MLKEPMEQSIIDLLSADKVIGLYVEGAYGTVNNRFVIG